MKTLILACVMAFSFASFSNVAPTGEVELVVSPNPTYVGEVITVSWTPEELPMIGYRIFTHDGEMVAEEQFDKMTHWIEIPGLEITGIYYLQMIDIKKRKYMTSFVVE